MDDKFIYYLVLGAIYLVSRMLKKKKPVVPTAPQQHEEEEYYETESQYESPKPAKPSSFEDLLKEISQEFEGRKEPQPVAQVVQPVEVITPIPEKNKLTREQKYVNRKHKEAAETLHRETLVTLVENVEEHEPHPVLELLQEEGGAANAVVLSEIMKRRF